MAWAVVAVGLLVPTSCALPEEEADRDRLEPLHGPVGTDVLIQQAAAPVAPPPEPVAETTRWRVGDVIDGRTLELYIGLEEAVATLGGIEVPIGDECLADLSADSLRFITGGAQSLDVSPSTPTNGRIDGALVTNEDGEDLAAIMLSLGLATVAQDAAGRAAVYDEIEATAREEGAGIWSGECDDPDN